jgi:DNA-binding response OmpR family regulator
MRSFSSSTIPRIAATLPRVPRVPGFRVVTAGDGQEALDAAHATDPDVILMDLTCRA